MHDELSEIDESIELQPVSERLTTQKASGRWWFYLVVGGGALLSIATVAAMIGVIVRVSGYGAEPIVVADDADPAALRAEAVRVFTNFDNAAQQNTGPPAAVHGEWPEIEAFLKQLESCAADSDHTRFRTLVDCDRLLKRVELMGGLKNLSFLDRRTVRMQMRISLEAEPYLSQLTVADVVGRDDDPSTRVIYAFGTRSDWHYPSEIRLWAARVGDTWKLYDWEELDLGITESEEWGVHCQYGNSVMGQHYERWGELLTEADELMANGDSEAAKEKLRDANPQLVPPPFQDFCWVLTGYRWAALDDYMEAQRCYERVQRPEETPGAYYGLMNCYRWPSRGEALKYAQLYEDAVGPNPELLEAKARLLAGIGRKNDAVQEWGRLLRIKPDDSAALEELIGSLPANDQVAFDSQLEQLHVPVKSVVQIASTLGQHDYPRLLQMAAFVNKAAPDSSDALYLSGLVKYLDGQYGEAARLYWRAFELDPERVTLVDDYVNAMAVNGKAFAALERVPDKKSAFESLFYSYDEVGLELPDDEYRQLIDAYRKLYPQDTNALFREADLAMTEERYEDAVRILRLGIKQLTAKQPDEGQEGEDNEEDELLYDINSFSYSLVAALYRLGPLKDAYDGAGDPYDSDESDLGMNPAESRFAQLTSMAMSDGRWDDVELLLEWHRKNEPDDPHIHEIEGEVAAHEKRWDDALRLFHQAMERCEDYEVERLMSRLMDISQKSGQWMDYYSASDHPNEAFDNLAQTFIAEERWDRLNALLELHRKRSADDEWRDFGGSADFSNRPASPDELRVAKVEADATWHQEDYRRYARIAENLLISQSAEILGYERAVVENRLLSALLRSDQMHAAVRLAQKSFREENSGGKLAIVRAASGDALEAKRLALQALEAENSSAGEFYENDDVGHVFLGESFRELHEKFPVDASFDAAPVLAVFLFAEAPRLKLSDIESVIEQLDVDVATAIKPLEASHKGVSNAYALRVGDATIFLATGQGRFDDNWQLDSGDAALVSKFDASNGWLAVGSAAWSELRRKPVQKIARRLSGQLARDQATAICVAGEEQWMDFSIFLATDELLSSWQATGNLAAFRDQGATLAAEQPNEVASRRAFMQAVRDHVRDFESTPGSRLEVVADVKEKLQIDPLRVDVTRVRRVYGNLEFDGVLKGNSVLISELRAGLPVTLHADRVRAIQIDDEPVVRRP